MRMFCHAIKSRDAYWDVVKGVGIMLVLMGHLLRYGSFPSRVIFNFHMPLFFFASGLFFRPEGIASMRELIGKIVRNLGIPWVYFCLICVAPYWVINGTIVPSTGVRIMVERFWRGNPHFCNSLWFDSYTRGPDPLKTSLDEAYVLMGARWTEFKGKELVAERCVLAANPEMIHRF